MSQMAFRRNIGKDWDGKTWNYQDLGLGAMLRIAECTDWQTKMAILSVPLHLAHIIIQYLSGVDKTSACWMLAQRFLEEEGRKCGLFCPGSISHKVVYKIQGRLGRNRRLHLPSVTIFKARTKARETYRAWLKATGLPPLNGQRST